MDNKNAASKAINNNDKKQVAQNASKTDFQISVRKQNLFGCNSDTPIADIQITDDNIIFVISNRDEKKIALDDLINVSSNPQSLKDQNCFSVYYKEYLDSKKTKFKIAELKFAVLRSYAKSAMIEHLKLNIRKKFTFEHLKASNEVLASDYFKSLQNKPQQVSQAINIIHYVYYYKNIIYFFSLFKKKYGREKSLNAIELDKVLNQSNNNNVNNNIIHKTIAGINPASQNNIIYKFGEKPNIEVLDNNNYNIVSNRGAYKNNDHALKDSDRVLSHNSRVKIYEKKESVSNMDEILNSNHINFVIESDKNKEDHDFKKMVLLQQAENLKSKGDELIQDKKQVLDYKSIKDFETFNTNKLLSSAELGAIQNSNPIKEGNILHKNPGIEIENLKNKIDLEKNDTFGIITKPALNTENLKILSFAERGQIASNNNNNNFDRMKLYQD